MKWLLALITVLGFPITHADEVTGKIISYGIYSVSDEHRMQEAPDSFSGAVRIYRGLPILVTSTNQIPAKIGTDFGFIYQISNLPAKDGDEIEIEKIAKTPPINKPDGTTAQKSEWICHKPVVGGCVLDYSGFALITNANLRRAFGSLM